MKRFSDRRASALAGPIREIRAGAEIRPVLTQALGEAFTGKVLRALTRVERIEGTGEGRSPGPGVKHQGTAKVKFAANPMRGENHAMVRHAVLLLLHVLGVLPPDSKRVISPKLWLGHQGGAKGEPRGKALANRIGVSVRELERYVTVFRQANILTQHQPPARELKERNPELVGRRSGHAYAEWKLIGEVPRELARTLKAWWLGHRPAPNVAAPPAPRTSSPTGAPVGALIAGFMARIPAPES